MSTQSNTLPAICALLWERWRVAKWTIPYIWACFTPLAFLFYVVIEPGVEVVIHAMWLPLFSALGVCWFAAPEPWARAQGGWRIPDHFRILPLSPRVFALARLGVTTIGGLLGVTAILLTDALLARDAAFVFHNSTVKLFLLLFGLGAWVNYWVIAAPAHKAAFFVGIFPIGFVVLLMGMIGWEHIPLSVFVALSLGGIALNAFGATTGRSDGLDALGRPTEWFQRLGSKARSVSPAERPLRAASYWRAAVWYEWQTFGMDFFLRVFLFVAIMGLAGALSGIFDEDLEFGFRFLPGFAVLAAFLQGLFPHAQNAQSRGTKPTQLPLLHPLSTDVMAASRLLGRAATLYGCTAAACIFALAMEWVALHQADPQWLISALPTFSVLFVLYFLLTWLASNAAVFVVAAVCPAVLIVWATGSQAVVWIYPVAVITVFLLLVGALLLVVHRGAMTVDQIGRMAWWNLIGTASALGPFLVVAFLFSNGETLAWARGTSVWLILPVYPGVLAASLFFTASLHRCRHGGPGWRLGGEKWGQ